MPAYAATWQALLSHPADGIPQDGLLCWLDAQDFLTADAAVATWPDRSGLGNHATQGTAGTQPTTRRGNIRSSSTMCVDMIGSKAMDLATFWGSSLNALTMVFVHRRTAVGLMTPTAAYTWIANNGGLGGANHYFGIYVQAGVWRITANKAGGGTSLDVSTGISWDPNPHVICVRWDGSTIYFAMDTSTYSTAWSTSGININSYNTLNNYRTSGGYGAWWMESKHYAVLAYNRCIAGSELMAIQAYYSIVLGTPGGTYYKFIDPSLGTAAHTWTPVLQRLSSGRLVMAYTVYTGLMETSASYIKFAYSDDDGVTWAGEASLVGDGSMVCNNGTLSLLGDGTLVLTYYRGATSGTPLGYCIRSTDGGATWSAEISMGDLTGLGYNWVPYSNGDVLMPNGDLLVPCFDNHGGGSTHWSFVAVSSDGGLTWSRRAWIAENYNETSFVAVGNTLYAALRSDSNTLWIAQSTDAGATWGTPVQVGSYTVAFSALTYDDGLFILYGKTTITPYYLFSWDASTWVKSTAQLTGNDYGAISALQASGRYYTVSSPGNSLQLFTRAAGKFV